MTVMTTRFLAFGLLAALTACGGGAEDYPDGDIVTPSGFRVVKEDVSVSSGVIRSGNLEYEGEGELTEVYREYLESMRSMGWSRTTGQLNGPKAEAKLRKDTRTCSLSFTSTKGVIRVNITISPTE